MNHGLTVAVLRRPMFIPRFVWLAVWFLPHGSPDGVWCDRSLQGRDWCAGVWTCLWSDAREVDVVWNEKHCLPATLTAHQNTYKIPWKEVFLGKQIVTQLLGNSSHCMELKLSFCLHKNPQLDPVLILINPVHVRTYVLFFFNLASCTVVFHVSSSQFFQPKFCCF